MKGRQLMVTGVGPVALSGIFFSFHVLNALFCWHSLGAEHVLKNVAVAVASL